MNYRETKSGYIIRLSHGEEIIETLEGFFREHEIASGIFWGIGAVKKATVGMYHLDRYEYDFQEFEEPHEITNLTGNVARYDGNVKLHIHVTLADAAYNARGGHLKEGVVDPTCEIYVADYGVEVNRAIDEYSQLPLLDL